MVVRPFNPSTAEAEAGGSQILAQRGQHTETLSCLKAELYMLFTLACSDYRNQGPNT